MTSLAETSSPGALPNRPEARTFRVEDLVSSMLSGKIRIPAFQRGIKWDPTDALALLDSIDRGYPVGALLLWRRPAPEDRLVHGSVIIDAPARPDALWVVDGEQRIVSLTRIFAGKGFPEEPFAAFYDTKQLQFKQLGKRDTPAAHDLPLTEVLDSSRLVKWLLAHPQFNLDIVVELGKRLRDFEIPAYVVDTDDEDTVREIFRRTNNTGKRMEASDMFHGLYGARSQGLANVQDVAAGLADLDFGPLDDSVLHNMLLATRGTDLSKDRVPRLSQEGAHQTMLDLALCARAAIRFLREDAGVPHVSLLPHQPPIFALARFFHLHRDPHPRSRELLARWLWRGTLAGGPNGDAAQVRLWLTAIGENEHYAVQSLLRAAPGRPNERLDLDYYSFRRARSKVQLIALLELGPRDLRNGELVAPATVDLADKNAYHMLVRTIVTRGSDSTRGLANRMFHPGARNGLVQPIVDCEDPALLASHAISDAARLALKLNHHDEFLRLRRADILAQVEAFTDRRAQWDELDSPPIEALRISGD